MKLFNNWKPTTLFWAFLPSIIGIIILICFVFLTFIHHKPSADFDYQATQTIGAFIGGVVPVFLSITTIILIYLTYLSNREELVKLNNHNNTQQEFNNKQIEFSNKQIELANKQASAALEQLEISNQQKFDVNFNSLFNLLETVIQEDKLRYDEIYKKSIQSIHDEFTKVARSKEKGIIDKNIKSGSLNSKLLTQIMNKVNFDYSTTIGLLDLVLHRLYEYIDLENRGYKDIYQLRITKLLRDRNIRNILMLSGLTNANTKSLIEKHSLLQNLEKSIDIKYTWFDKKGTHIQETYKMDLKKYFKEGAWTNKKKPYYIDITKRKE